MFNNIIYFIIALLIFSISNSGKKADDLIFMSPVVLLITWSCFSYYSHLEFRRIRRKFERGVIPPAALSSMYQRATIRLSVLALCLFAFSVHFAGLKWWLSKISPSSEFSVLQGSAALLYFIFYLATIWYFSYPVYIRMHRSEISRKSYVFSNVRLNLPILLPWFFLTLLFDLIDFFPILNHNGFLDSTVGQIAFFAVSLGLLIVFLPFLVSYLWGCKPLKPSEKARRLKAFLKEKGFKYRKLLNWPVFEGQMMTAGIMGVIPKYRYLLVTDSLLNALSDEELEAVMAHEMGHARYRHLIFHMVFFVGFMAVAVGIYDISLYLLYLFPSLESALNVSGGVGESLLGLVFSLPFLLTLMIYFRYIMGFFMRHFERQADLYSEKIIGTPVYTISSLEKIASLSGKIRDLPSWHHFSIKERVEHLWRTLREPDLLMRQTKFLVVSFSIYFILMGGLVYFFNFSQIKEKGIFLIVEKGIKRKIFEEPRNVAPLNVLAMLYFEKGRYNEAIRLYKRALELEPDNPEVLNNLGYIYAEEEVNLDEAMSLVQKALKLRPDSGYIADSLGWIYFKKGSYDDALYYLEKAVNVSPNDPTINEHLGDVFLAKKNFQKALDLYRKALYLGHPVKDRLKKKIDHTEKVINN